MYRFDFTTGKSSVFKRPKVDFKPAAFETKQVFFASKDGTKIPMFLVSKKGLKLDGQNPTLVFTGDHDDRVVPAHSFKFAAQLQADQSALAPALIRIETNAGHGAGKPTAKLIDEAAVNGHCREELRHEDQPQPLISRPFQGRLTHSAGVAQR